MLLPTLTTLYTSSVWNYDQLEIFDIPGNRTYTYDTYSAVGKAKTVLGYKTKGFVPGKTWMFNPYDVRTAEIIHHKSTGRCWRYGDHGQTPILDWNGCLSAWLQYHWHHTYPSGGLFCQDTDVYRCLSNAMEKISTPEADYAVMLAELSETIGMLINPLAGLRKFIRKVARRKQSFKDTADLMSSTWLEIRYGVIPFMNDINVLLKRTEEIVRLKGQTYRVSSKVPLLYNKYVEDRSWAPAGNSGLQVSGINTVTEETTLYSHVLYTPIVDFALNSLDGRNLPSVLWEKTPYSFVVDWFIDVGSWLRAIQVNPDILFYGNTVFCKHVLTEKTQALWACNQVGTTPITGVVDDFATFTEFSGYRFVNVSLPVLPQVNVDLSSLKRQLDSASLIWQKIAKSLSPRRV